MSPYAYLLAAVGTGLVLACFAEVSSQFQEAGGPYLYTRAAFGPFVGIQIGWQTWLVRLTAAAANANLFVIYLAEFWPEARNNWWRLGILTVLVGCLAVINYRGVSSGVRLSNVFALTKILPLGLFVGVGLFFVKKETLCPAFAAQAGDWAEAVLVLAYAFGGAEAALIPLGEASNPRRDAPFALFVALAVVTLLFTSIQLVVRGVLPTAAQAEQPLWDAAMEIAGPAGATFITLAVLISIYGYLSAMMLSCPRLTFALAERGNFPSLFGAIHSRFRTPHLSIGVFALLVWVLAATATFRWNVTLSAITRLFTYMTMCASLLALRRKQPREPVFRLPAGQVFAILGVGFSLVLVTRIGLSELLVLGATMAIGTVNWGWIQFRRRETVGRSV